MRNQKLILSLFFLGSLAGLTSCGDDEVAKAGKEEVKAAFESTESQLAMESDVLMTSSGYEAINELSVLTDGSNTFPLGKKSPRNREQVIDNIKAGVYAVRGILTHSTSNIINGDEAFNYNEKKGVYRWNPELGEEGDFEKTGPSSIVEIWFPTEGSEENNAQLLLTAYAEEETPNGDEPYSPTLVKASILVDEVKEIELNLDVDYGSEDEPVKGKVYYFVNPFAINVSFDDTKATSSSFSESFTKNGNTLIAFGASVQYYEPVKDPMNIKSGSAYIQLIDLKFTINAKAENATTENPYAAIKISIKLRNKVAGSIFFEPGQDEEPAAFIKYSDGSTEPLSDALPNSNPEIVSILR